MCVILASHRKCSRLQVHRCNSCYIDGQPARHAENPNAVVASLFPLPLSASPLRPLPSLRPLPQLSYFHFWRFTFCPRTTYGRTTFLRPRGKAPARPPARIASCNRSFFVLSIALVPLCDRNNEMTRCLHLAVKGNRRQIGEERTRRRHQEGGK